MKKILLPIITAAAMTVATQTFSLTLTSTVLKNSTKTTTFPAQYAYCKANGKGGVEPSNDISPPLAWSDIPKGTKSFVLIFKDPSAPNTPIFDTKGHTIPANAARGSFYHWVLINIPAKLRSLPEGAGSKGFVPHGKDAGITRFGLSGLNSYTDTFASPLSQRVDFEKNAKKSLKGLYGQYDGPCPPFNDAALHQYTFTLYALGVPTLHFDRTGLFTGDQVITELQKEGHVLAEASIVTPYTTNPALLKH